MCDNQLAKAERIFRKAVRIADPEEREAHIREACAGHPELRREIESLLTADKEAGQFLEAPPIDFDVTLNDSPLAEGPGTIIGPYRLLEKIGEGGMATVYMAQQKKPLLRKVAVKIIKLGMDTREVIARFEVERQALAMMDHPNIAKVLDADATDTGRPYFVMELVAGISITDYCDKNKLTTQERLKLLIPVCNAIHHAHQKGIIHRDLKPSNIMVTMHDGCPVPMVIDFGIAKAISRQLTEKTVFTRYAQMIGTPEYMSPEQAEMSAIDIDTRTDIYSLGVVLYELLTGALPFDQETLRSAAMAEIQRIIKEDEPLRPSTRLSKLGNEAEKIAAQRSTNITALANRLHRELEWIPMKAMRKDRTRRYTSASEFAHDIRNYLNGIPLIAGPELASYRLQKFLHRYRLPVAVTAGIAAALVIGFVVSTSFYVRTMHAQAQMAELESQIEVDKRLSTSQQLNAEGRYQAALAEIETNLQEGKPHIKMQLLHAQLLFDLGRPTEAEPILQALLEGEPKTAAAAHYLLARINLPHNPDKAKEYRQLAESLQPHTADAHVLRAITAETPDVTINWLSQALDLEPGNHAARQARAWAYYGSHDFAKMLQDAEVIVATRPKDKFSYALRALARREQGYMEEALQDHSRVIEMCQHNSELARALSQRQETFWRMKDYRSALGDARHCVLLKPKELTYRMNLGRTLFATDQYERAAQEFELIHRGPGYMKCRALEIMVRHMLDAVNEGTTVSFPEDIANAWPFPLMRWCASTYEKQVPKEGTRLVQGAYGRSSWSPDGKQLAYPRSEFWGSENNALGSALGAIPRGVEVLDIRTGQTRVVVTNGFSPAWSPDGRYIAFVRAPTYFAPRRQEVWLIPVEGGEARRIAQGGYPSWTNDPKHLYFQSRSEGALYSLDIDDPSAEPKYVLDCPGLYPSVSPDGQYVAYVLGGVLTVVEHSSGQEVIKWVVPGSGEYCLAQWSPNGHEISVSVIAGFIPASGLWVFNLKEKQGWHVLDPMGALCNWSKDRTRIAIDVQYPICEVWLVETDPNQSTREALGLLTNRAAYIRKNWNGFAQFAESAKGAKLWTRNKILMNLSEIAANQYDYGQFEDALWLLERIDELHQTLQRETPPEVITLISKVLDQLGHQDESQTEQTQ